jgi:hypothetical protein
MEITMTIPDDVAAEIQNGTSLPLSRRLLELAALEAYKSGLLTSSQVQKLLGFGNRSEVDAFLKAHAVRQTESLAGSVVWVGDLEAGSQEIREQVNASIERSAQTLRADDAEP